MIELTILNWLLFDGLPLWREETVVQVHYRLSYKIVSKEVIIVIGLDHKRRCTWEFNIEFKVLVELRVSSIKLVVLPLIINFLTTCQDAIRIRSSPQVLISKVISFYQVYSTETLSLSYHHPSNNILIGILQQEIRHSQLTQSYLLHLLLKLTPLFLHLQLLKVKLQLLPCLLLIYLSN